MARFSLSPKPSSFHDTDGFSKEVLEFETDESSFSKEPVDESESETETEEDELEEAHPLGFSNRGGLRRPIGLLRGADGLIGRSYPPIPFQSPPSTQSTAPNVTPSLTMVTPPGRTSTRQSQRRVIEQEQSPKVMHYFLQTKTPVLLKHHIQVSLSNQSMASTTSHDIYLVENHLESLHLNQYTPRMIRSDEGEVLSSTYTPIPTHPTEKQSLLTSSTRITSPLQEAIQDLKRCEQEIQSQIARQKEEMEQKHRIAVQSFKLLLQQEEQEVAKILEKEHLLQKEQEHLLAQEEKELEDRRLVELSKVQEKQRLEEENQKRREKELQLQKEEEERRQVELAQKYEYITQAYQTVDTIKSLRQDLETFEKNSDKNISKRRLEMKKIARGKLNTLSHDKDKIISIAQDIVQAMHSVIKEDEHIRQQTSMGGGAIIYDTASLLGTKYFMDLIASNVIVRIQAEGFNGPRGDGFPLAIMLAMVSTQLPEEFITLIQAHIYMVCPTAIPALPKPLPGSSEVELMDSLGMIQDKHGTYESFDRFLTRTEGIISMVGGIMASLPENHRLFGGREGAFKWLERFIDLLPDKESPLPLLTAPVLYSFLTATGHMLALSYRSQFQSQFDYITSSILPRLDESTIGLPSATRLKKLFNGGINGFISELPNGALTELYNVNVGSFITGLNVEEQNYYQNQRHSQTEVINMNLGPMSNANDPKGSVFSSMCSTAVESSMNVVNQQGTQSIPFGIPSNQSTTQNSFPISVSSSAMSQVSPFSSGGSIFTNHQQSSFGNSTSYFPSGVSPFGVSQTAQVFGSQPSIVGADTTKQSPFSFGSISTGASNFGTVTHSQPIVGPFGSTSSSNTSIFGTGGMNQSFYGAPSFSSPTPFGSSKNITTMNSSGTNAGFSNFGNPSHSSNTSSSQSPFSHNSFGGGNTLSQSNFSGNNNNRQPCKFFQQGRCRNGDYCKFSHSQSQESATAFSRSSSNQYASPFGAPRR